MSFLSMIKYLVITSLLLPFIFVLPSNKSTSATKNKPIRLNRYQTHKIESILAQDNSPITQTKRTALIIGNADYKIAGRLKNPINDAKDIAKNLRELGFDVTLLTDLSLQQIEQAIENFNRQLRQGGVGLFYFSGHGVQVEGENYLVPVEATLERGQNVRYEAYPVGKLLGAIEDARIDTLLPKGEEILGSTSPLKPDPLRYLAQRWFSPQALTFRVPLGS